MFNPLILKIMDKIEFAEKYIRENFQESDYVNMYNAYADVNNYPQISSMDDINDYCGEMSVTDFFRRINLSAFSFNDSYLINEYGDISSFDDAEDFVVDYISDILKNDFEIFEDNAPDFLAEFAEYFVNWCKENHPEIDEQLFRDFIDEACSMEYIYSYDTDDEDTILEEFAAYLEELDEN